MNNGFTQNELVDYEIFNEGLNTLLGYKVRLLNSGFCSMEELREIHNLRNTTDPKNANAVLEKVKAEIKSCERILGV